MQFPSELRLNYLETSAISDLFERDKVGRHNTSKHEEIIVTGSSVAGTGRTHGGLMVRITITAIDCEQRGQI